MNPTTVKTVARGAVTRHDPVAHGMVSRHATPVETGSRNNSGHEAGCVWGTWRVNRIGPEGARERKQITPAPRPATTPASRSDRRMAARSLGESPSS